MISFLVRAPKARGVQGLPRLQMLLGGLFVFMWLSGGQCSRERVESLNAMNEGVVFAAQKRYLDAVERLQQAAALDPTNDQAYWNLAIVHMEMQKCIRYGVCANCRQPP